MLKPYKSKIGYDVKLVMEIRGCTPANKYDSEHVNHLLQSQNQTTGLILKPFGYGTLHSPLQVLQRHGGDLQIGVFIKLG